MLANVLYERHGAVHTVLDACVNMLKWDFAYVIVAPRP